MIKKFIAFSLLCLLSPIIFASQTSGADNSDVPNSSGFYLSAQWGIVYRYFGDDFVKYDPQQVALNWHPFGKTFPGERISAGYQFNQYTAMELGYLIAPDFDMNLGLGLKMNFNVDTFSDAFAKFICPITPLWNVYFKVGGARVETQKASVNMIDFQPIATYHDAVTFAPAAGIGTSYYFTNHLSAGLAYTYYQPRRYLERVSFTGVTISFLF